MPSFRYRALTQTGEVVLGAISAPSAAEVARRMEYLGLVPIETITEERAATASHGFRFGQRPRSEDVTIFTRDLALLLKAGSRLDSALELLSGDIDVGRLRPVVAKVHSAVISGESFGEALSRHPSVFPEIYVALVRVGEASGTLDRILEVLASERARADSLRQRLYDAMRYPAFVFGAALCVMLFFLLFVLPQFASILRDFNAKLDPIVAFFFGLSDLLRSQGDVIAGLAIVVLLSSWMLLRRQAVRASALAAIGRLPLIRSVFTYYRTGLFCRNLGVLLGSGVNLSAALRILADMMAISGDRAIWTKMVERVRHGGKLSDALSETNALPVIAVRMLKLAEETGQLPMLAGQVAEFFEVKLQRSLERIIGIAGPAAIMAISVVVGGLIVSVMTALLSVNQIVG